VNKSIFLSKTFWANALTFLVALAGLLQGQEWIANNPTVVSAIVMAVGVMNVFLRAITDEPVKIP
jgi:hypothetical protein